MKTALVKFVVSILSLLTAILNLLTAVAILLTRGAQALTAAILAHRPTQRAPAPQAAPKPSVAHPAPVAAGPTNADKLRSALVGMGFPAPRVDQFVAGVRERAEHEALQSLIKEGLQKLYAPPAN